MHDPLLSADPAATPAQGLQPEQGRLKRSRSVPAESSEPGLSAHLLTTQDHRNHAPRRALSLATRGVAVNIFDGVAAPLSRHASALYLISSIRQPEQTSSRAQAMRIRECACLPDERRISRHVSFHSPLNHEWTGVAGIPEREYGSERPDFRSREV